MKNNCEQNENLLISESLKWILRIRWGILAVLTLLFLSTKGEMPSSLLLLFISVAIGSLVSSFVFPMINAKKKSLEVLFLVQISMDIILFSGTLFYSKDLQQPLSLIYFLPIILSSVVISVNTGLAIASVCSLVYIYILSAGQASFASIQLVDVIIKIAFFHIFAFLAGFLSTINVKQKVEVLINKNKKYKEELSLAQKHIIDNKMELNASYEQLNERVKEIEMTNTQITNLYEEVEKTNIQLSNKVKALSILHEVGNAINSVHDLNKLLNFIIICATEELHSDNGSIMILNKDKNELEVKIAKGLDKETIRASRVKVGEGISGWVAKAGDPLLINNIYEDPRFANASRNKYPSKSFLSVPLKIKEKIIGVINLNNKRFNEEFTQDDLEFLMTLANHAAISIENAQLYRNIRKSYFDTISALAMTIEAKDPHTRGHSKRVTEYAVAIAKKIDMTPNRIEIIRYAAILHDIGKIGISEKIISKKNSLSHEEYIMIKNHPLIGESIIEPIDFLQSVKPIIRYHHERYDGSGYPDGIMGEEIPIEARILSLADSYDAMTSDRPYRNRLSHQDALMEVVRNSGTQFDPYLKEKFLEIF
ncbi:HD domain-containing protein [Candidatus Poribacteria bacterium]|nr:HD domain-containing protein [Candidatus Poribacteria bacterium]